MDPSSLMLTLLKQLLQLQSIQASEWLNIPAHRATKSGELQVGFKWPATSTRYVDAPNLRNGRGKLFSCFVLGVFFSARKYQINVAGHCPGSPVSTDSSMSMAAVHRRPPKKQKQHPVGHPGNQRREAYNEGTHTV